MLFIGIDPGNKGGVAVIDSQTENVRVFKLPPVKTSGFIGTVIQLLWPYKDVEVFAVLEKSQASANQASRAAFTYGYGSGVLRTCLCWAEIEHEVIRPVTWQTALSCRTGGNKNISKNAAQKRYPKIKVTHWNADALLIATYAKALWEHRHQKTN